MNIEKLCHGQQCYLRFPGVCNRDPATVVPCHLRRGGIAGGGQKPPPIACLPGCFDCHSALDGRVSTKFTRDELDAMTLKGYVQWMCKLWSGEYLIAVTP